jgi:hypothetical protein
MCFVGAVLAQRMSARVLRPIEHWQVRERQEDIRGVPLVLPYTNPIAAAFCRDGSMYPPAILLSCLLRQPLHAHMQYPRPTFGAERLQ